MQTLFCGKALFAFDSRKSPLALFFNFFRSADLA